MKYCCNHAKKQNIITFFCKNCKKSICGRHATIWFYKVIHCPYCFSTIGKSSSVLKPEIIRGSIKGKSKRIPACFIIDGTYVAGAQMHVMYLMDVLTKMGFDCYLVCLQGGGRWFDKFRTKCVSMFMAFGNPDDENALILDFILKTRAKSVNTHLLYGAERMYSLGITGYIATIHSFLTQHESPSGTLTNKALRAAKIIITPSHRMAGDLVSWFGSDDHPLIKVIPNCVDVHKFSPHKSLTRKKKKQLSISYIGRLDRDKFDIRMFVGTLHKLVNSGLQIHVEIAGDGELKDELQESLKYHNLGNVVTFRGFVDNVSLIYSKTDVVFFPSLNEGLSIAALEAMAMGRIVVATDVGDMKLLASHGGAIIVPKGDTIKAATAIQSVWYDDKLKKKIEMKAHKFAFGYRVEKWSTMIVPLFKNILK